MESDDSITIIPTEECVLEEGEEEETAVLALSLVSDTSLEEGLLEVEEPILSISPVSEEEGGGNAIVQATEGRDEGDEGQGEESQDDSSSSEVEDLPEEEFDGDNELSDGLEPVSSDEDEVLRGSKHFVREKEVEIIDINKPKKATVGPTPKGPVMEYERGEKGGRLDKLEPSMCIVDPTRVRPWIRAPQRDLDPDGAILAETIKEMEELTKKYNELSAKNKKCKHRRGVFVSVNTKDIKELMEAEKNGTDHRLYYQPYTRAPHIHRHHNAPFPFFPRFFEERKGNRKIGLAVPSPTHRRPRHASLHPHHHHHPHSQSFTHTAVGKHSRFKSKSKHRRSFRPSDVSVDTTDSDSSDKTMASPPQPISENGSSGRGSGRSSGKPAVVAMGEEQEQRTDGHEDSLDSSTTSSNKNSLEDSPDASLLKSPEFSSRYDQPGPSFPGSHYLPTLPANRSTGISLPPPPGFPPRPPGLEPLSLDFFKSPLFHQLSGNVPSQLNNNTKSGSTRSPDKFFQKQRSPTSADAEQAEEPPTCGCSKNVDTNPSKCVFRNVQHNNNNSQTSNGCSSTCGIQWGHIPPPPGMNLSIPDQFIPPPAHFHNHNPESSAPVPPPQPPPQPQHQQSSYSHHLQQMPWYHNGSGQTQRNSNSSHLPPRILFPRYNNNPQSGGHFIGVHSIQGQSNGSHQHQQSGGPAFMIAPRPPPSWQDVLQESSRQLFSHQYQGSTHPPMPIGIGILPHPNMNMNHNRLCFLRLAHQQQSRSSSSSQHQPQPVKYSSIDEFNDSFKK